MIVPFCFPLKEGDTDPHLRRGYVICLAVRRKFFGALLSPLKGSSDPLRDFDPDHHQRSEGGVMLLVLNRLEERLCNDNIRKNRHFRQERESTSAFQVQGHMVHIFVVHHLTATTEEGLAPLRLRPSMRTILTFSHSPVISTFGSVVASEMGQARPRPSSAPVTALILHANTRVIHSKTFKSGCNLCTGSEPVVLQTETQIRRHAERNQPKRVTICHISQAPLCLL